MARLIGFAWNKAASMGVDISALRSTGIFPLNRIRVPEYFSSIPDTRETVNFYVKAPADNGCIMELTLRVTYLSRDFINYSEYYTPF
jgi:hypothetical protein